MSRSNDISSAENIINQVMGVETQTLERASSPEKFETTEIDIKAILVYKLGTILQIAIMIVALWGMEKLVVVIDRTALLPNWVSICIAGLFFTLLSIRSRVFSLLDNTRSRKTYDNIIRPKWGPPPLTFPIVWMIIAVLRVISSLLVWTEMNHHFLIPALMLFVVHLVLGDTWNTIFSVEQRLGAAVPVVILGPCLSCLLVTIVYWQTNSLAGMILAPSCIWLTIAAILVFRIWQLNGAEPLYPLKIKPLQ